jgi:hypothetical protein
MFMLLAFLAFLVWIYSAAGLLFPRLRYIGTRRRAALMGATAFVVFVGATAIATAVVPPEERQARQRAAQAAREAAAAAEERERLAKEEAYRKAKESSARMAERRRQEEAAARAKVDVTLTAEQLLAAYDNNEAAANARFLDRRASVTGIVKNISQTLGTTAVAIGTQKEFEFDTVSCHLEDSELPEAQRLFKGEKIAVRGTVSEGLGFVLLKNCTID